MDLTFRFVSFYNTAMKVFFIASSAYVVYLMKYRFRYAMCSNWGSAVD